MAKFKVQIEVDAPDPMQALIYQQGIQNVVDELAEHQHFLVELADVNVARGYKNKIMGLINNPLIKKIGGSFKL
jgi:hypothetical protein